MSDSAIVATVKLGAPPWPTLDPFLFCVHHDDAYPKGNDQMGPDASLAGRRIGMDFAGIDGWRMYHGDVIPGFPRHPHRGFETLTLGRSGYIDHSDSLGATARFGAGDAQWMTAGRGIVHSEMFPLVKRESENPTGLFQIWINLPASDKMVDPYFTMFWRDTIPDVVIKDDADRQTRVKVFAGELAGRKAPAPPPNSWASRPESSLAVWTIELEAGAEFTMPRVPDEVIRTLYVVQGSVVTIDGETVEPGYAAQLRAEASVKLVGGDGTSELLLLQGRPIGEPVAQHGPFVMNTADEIQQAFVDYRRTEFGGWPWESDGPAHAREETRFAIHADGRKERPGG